MFLPKLICGDDHLLGKHLRKFLHIFNVLIHYNQYSYRALILIKICSDTSVSIRKDQITFVLASFFLIVYMGRCFR